MKEDKSAKKGDWLEWHQINAPKYDDHLILSIKLPGDRHRIIPMIRACHLSFLF
jgi:hypothetical protein